MARHILNVPLVLSLLLLLPPTGQARSGLSTPRHPDLRLLRSDGAGVALELTTPAYQVSTGTLPAGTFHRLTVPGYHLTLEPGKPQVPVLGVLLGVPPDARVEVGLLADDAVPLPGRFRLLPAPRPVPLTDELQPGQLAYEPDGTAYASDALYPAEPARITGDAWLRGQRIVRLELHPFQYNPAQGTLVLHRRLRVEVRFLEGTRKQGNKETREKGNKGERGRKGTEGEKGIREQGNKGKREQGGVQDSPFEPVLREMLLNYEEARAWRGQPVSAKQGDYPDSANPKSETCPERSRRVRNPRWKITVDHDGLYRLTYADLQAAGMDVGGVDPRAFHMSSQGQDVAIYVAGEDDGRFDPDDFILFYGQKFRGTTLAQRYADEMAPWLALCSRCRLAGMLEKYTDENVYWLTASGTPGPRMATIDGTPTDTAPVPAFYTATIRAEQSHEWYTHHFTSEDTWFWQRIQPGPADATRTYTTTLTAVAMGSFTATVRASIVSRSSNSGHHTRFYLNGGSVPLDDAIWDGKSRHTFEAQVPQWQLLSSVNHLYLPLVGVNTQSARRPNNSGSRIGEKLQAAFEGSGPGLRSLDGVVQLGFAVLYNGAMEDMYFDWFEVEYARRFVAENDQLLFPGEQSGTWQYEIVGFTAPDIQVFDVTKPLTPRRVVNPRITPADGSYRVAFQVRQKADARYLAVAAPAVQRPRAITRYVPPDPSLLSGQALRSPDNGADYIIITHRQFRDAVQRLADYRAARGLRVKVVDVEDLYNEFNDGIFHPIAIRNFLAHAYANWQPPAPGYVLLVGDGHWNFKGYGVERYGPPEPIYMPPNLAFVDPWQGEVDTANLLATVVGDDILPDLAIGRLPVNSVAELNAAIDKIIAYEQATPQDLSPSETKDWQHHALFVADNVPDAAGDFVALSEDVIADHLPADFQADRIYLNDYLGNGCPPSCSAVNAAIVDDLNNTGALLVNYVGHASVERWAHEQIFVNGDIPSLANGDRLPVVLSMTCLDGYWIYPNRPSLVEELVRTADRGAVATFSPTGLGVATGHHVLDRRFFDAVFDDGLRVLGPATVAAKLALYASGGNYDLIHTFTIFGDPALRLQVPPP